MKRMLLFTAILITSLTTAQKECEYSSNFTDSIGTYKSTKEHLIYERVFGNHKTALYFSLINADGLPSLNLEIIQKDVDFIPAQCLNKNAKIYFQLNNGKIVTLLSTETESCGNLFRKDGENIRILSGYFLFMKDTFEALKTNPISFMRVVYDTETIDYIFKSELISELDKKTYYPENYFINYLKCIE